MTGWTQGAAEQIEVDEQRIGGLVCPNQAQKGLLMICTRSGCINREFGVIG